MSDIKTVGIIGLGSFGSFLTRFIPTNITVLGHDLAGRDDKPVVRTKLVSLDKIAKADILVLAVPLHAYAQLLPKLATRISPDTLLVDICSVKALPEQYYEKYLPEHTNMLVSHPLFGPQSVMDELKGHRLIVTKQQGKRAAEVITYLEDVLQLDVSKMTANEHDQIMAQIHALTFFVAKALATIKIPPTPFVTPSYSMILDLVNFSGKHSTELFETIEYGNPYAAQVRDELVASFDQLATELREKKVFEEIEP